MSNNKPNYLRPFMVVTSLFFMWGFLTVFVDSLIPRLREVFELSLGQVGTLQTAFFVAYFVVAIPSGFLLAKVGYKKGILIGLSIMGLGCLLYWLAASMRSYPVFLAAFFILAGGMAILQVAANPYVAVLGPAESASSRLNLSQAFNSLGTLIAPIIGAQFLLSDNILTGDEIGLLNEADKLQYYVGEAGAVQGPFIVLALCLLGLAGVVALFKLPQILGSSSSSGGYMKALGNKRLVMGAIGIFVYVGAEVAIGSYLVNYFLDMKLDEIIPKNPTMLGIADSLFSMFGRTIEGVDAKGVVGIFVTFYWGGAMVGRFIGAALMRVLKPAYVLSFFGMGAIALVLISMNTMGLTAMWSILLVGLFNSIMFPTIFTLGIEELGDLKPQGSGILVSAILGGGVVPPLYGALSDANGFKLAFILVLVCYAYIMFYGWSSTRSSTSNQSVTT